MLSRLIDRLAVDAFEQKEEPAQDGLLVNQDGCFNGRDRQGIIGDIHRLCLLANFIEYHLHIKTAPVLFRSSQQPVGE